MNSENADQCSVPQPKPNDRIREFYKKSKFSYSRDFLFSLAELDICKRLPSGFDSSMLRELDDQSTSVLHSYPDSDVGRYQGILSHCSWQNPEKGLLGSGASTRVHRGAETCVHVGQGSHFHLLNRSSDPYRPPHLCKAKFYSSEESKDYCNEETFGSPDNLNQGRSEEEKLRRDSFELMRKEQEMAAQEKKKRISNEKKEKAKFYSREESKDYCNEETFGSPDNLNQGRSEEEKLRRDSFELMRKEQEMAAQEKKKRISNEQNENLDSDIAIVLEDSGVHKDANMHIKSNPCDVKEGHPENLVFCSSDLTHQFLEGEKKITGDQEVIEYDSTEVLFGTNAFYNLMKSAPMDVTKEISTELFGRCTPAVHSCECLEDSFQSKIYGRYSAQNQLINKRSSYDVKDSQSISSSCDAASQHFLSFSQKGAGLTDLAESSTLNMWFSDTPYVSETGNDDHQLNKSGGACINNFDNNPLEPISGYLVRDSHSTALAGTQKDLTSRSKQNDPLESQIPHLVVDNYITPLTINEFGSIREDEGIFFLSFNKQTGLSKRNSNLLVSDTQANIGLELQGGPESKLSSQSSFHDLAICLPEEDSLITVDDYILPQDSIFVDAGVTSSASVNRFDRLSYYGLDVDNNKSDLAGSRSPTSYHGSDDLMSSETYFNNLRIQQSDLQQQLHHSPLKPVKARTSLPKSLASQKGSTLKPRDPKSYPHDLQPLQNLPRYAHIAPSQHLRPAATQFDHYGNYQLRQGLPVPGSFLPQQLYGMPRVAFPQHTSGQVPCFQNPVLNSSQYYNHQRYENLEKASPKYYMHKRF